MRGELPSVAAAWRSIFSAFARLAVHGLRERQVAQHRGLILRQRQGALEEGNGLVIVAFLGQHRSAGRDDAPVGVAGIVGNGQQLLGGADLVEVERQPAVFAGQLAALPVVDRNLLQHRHRAALLAHGLEIARIAERRLQIARIFAVGLAPVLGGLQQIIADAAGAADCAAILTERPALAGRAGRTVG